MSALYLGLCTLVRRVQPFINSSPALLIAPVTYVQVNAVNFLSSWFICRHQAYPLAMCRVKIPALLIQLFLSSLAIRWPFPDSVYLSEHGWPNLNTT